MPSIFSSGPHAFADDTLDTLQELLAQTSGTRRLGSTILRLVELTGACRVDLVTFGRRERADLLGFGRRFRGDLLRFRKASGGRISASALAVIWSASRSASRCAAIISVSLRRSAISRSRAVITCSSA